MSKNDKICKNMQNNTLYFGSTDFNSNFSAYLAIFWTVKKNTQMFKNPGPNNYYKWNKQINKYGD